MTKSPKVHSRDRTESGQRRKVLQLAKELSTTLGNAFFQSMVKHLAASFHTDCVWIAELCGTPPDCLRTLAISSTWNGSDTFEQKLHETAAGKVIADGIVECSKDAWRHYPADELITSMHADGYLGIRLADAAGQPLGLVAILSRKRFQNIQLMRSVLEAFVARTAAELERKRDEDLRRENEERYHAFISTNPDAMWRLELEKPMPLSMPEEEQVDWIYRYGYAAECNDAAAHNVGMTSAHELEGARLEEFAPRSMSAEFVNELKAASHAGYRTWATEVTRVDRTGRPVYRLRTQVGIVNSKGELSRIWFTTRDITELRLVEQSLAASEARFSVVLQNIQLAAVILELDGSVTCANEFFLRLTRMRQEDVRRRKWLAGLIPEGELDQWKATLEPDEHGHYAAVHFEGTLLPVGGSPLKIAWDTIALHGPDNRLTGLAAIGRDITRQEALEAEVRQAQKLESVGRLAAGVAHDFNNLLTVILGRAGQLHQGAKEGTQERESLAEIERAAAQCACLTGELLAFSRKQQLRPKLTNLNDVIKGDERIIRTLAGDRVKLVLNLAPQLGRVSVDPVQIQRAVANLVTNARDAMPEGGTLTITTSATTIRPDDLALSAVPPGHYIQLSVSDTGIGVTEKVRAHLFEPFFTTKPVGMGTGLGLAMVYGIVTQSAGHINVLSQPGKGTRFDLMFPAAREP